MTLLRRALPLLPLALLAAGAGSAATPIARIDVLGQPLNGRYGVRIVALVEAIRVTRRDPQADLNGTRTATVRWTGTWKNVQVRVLRATATTLSISADSTGSIRGSFEFADRRPSRRCKGTKAIRSPARLLVKATRPQSGPTTFNLTSFAAAEIEPSFCPDDATKLPVEAAKVTVQGLRVTISNKNQGVSVEREGLAGRLFFPIEQLQDGLGFSVSADGLRRIRSSRACGYPFCTKTVRFEARLTFKPVR